jgi:catechol-2,3-dioxygenase
MVTLKRLGHVVIKVRDLERSERFYAGILGLRITGRIPGRMTFLSSPEGDSHDLALYNVGPQAESPKQNQVGLFHFAYQVPSHDALESAYHHLKARGVKILSAVHHGTNESLYLEDPDGHTVELTYELPREEWMDREHPFADRTPLTFQETSPAEGAPSDLASFERRET